MKFNGTIFSKPQQDQLKENIGNELEKVSAKVDEVDARMLNYTGTWVSGNDYHKNDIVSYNGQLYEVINDHKSSDASIPPKNTDNYTAMTKTTLRIEDINTNNNIDTYVKITSPTTHDFYGRVDGMTRYFVPIGMKSSTQSYNAYAISIDGTSNELYVYLIDQPYGTNMTIRKITISVSGTITFTAVTAPSTFHYRVTD